MRAGRQQISGTPRQGVLKHALPSVLHFQKVKDDGRVCYLSAARDIVHRAPRKASVFQSSAATPK